MKVEMEATAQCAVWIIFTLNLFQSIRNQMHLDKLCFEQKQDSQEKVCTSKVVNVKVAQAGTAKKFLQLLLRYQSLKKNILFGIFCIYDNFKVFFSPFYSYNFTVFYTLKYIFLIYTKKLQSIDFSKKKIGNYGTSKWEHRVLSRS